MRITPLKIENYKEAKELLSAINVSSEGLRILSAKSLSVAFKIEGIKSWEANIIKQHLLSLGSDSAIERAALVKNIKTTTILFGNINQLKKLCEKLKNQPFSLKEISRKVSFYLDNLFKNEFIFKIKGKELKIKQPVICGVINVTPDSFSGDGLLQYQISKIKYQKLLLEKVEGMIREGAKIIDVGGESTRPFSKPISEEEEIRRVIPPLKVIRRKFKEVLLSIDTYKFKVARAAANEGVHIINDITALRNSPNIASLIEEYKLGCVLMHMKGSPRNMQINPIYKNVVEDIIDFFEERLCFCEKQGIEKCQLLLDPGIGFGKRLEDNLKIINELYKLKIFGLPVFLGLSRKSFIGDVLGVKVAEKRVLGTAVSNAIAYVKGANILRVHDVKETAQALKIAYSVLNN
ncbi:MAG: dihydropteroate synthase [Candidatus Omnitrophota bacterium]|nr:dihydropteroate synthase [Candidatus Omnitrophota bacterium]